MIDSMTMDSTAPRGVGHPVDFMPTAEARGILAAISEPVRWSLLRGLAHGESCVCGLQQIVPMATNLLSYHMKILREADLVTSTRRGRLVFYRLRPDAQLRIQSALPFHTMPPPLPPTAMHHQFIS